MLLIMNVVGLPGRIIPALVADRLIGPLNTLIILAVMCSILLYCWIAVSSLPGLTAFVVFYGFVNGGVQGLFLSALSTLTKDLTKMGTRFGMVCSIVAFSAVIGAPIAGAIIDAGHGSFFGVQVFGGTAAVLGAGILAVARGSATNWAFRRAM
jgi:hypothetical protein